VPFLTICGPTRYTDYDVHNALGNGCLYVGKVVKNGTVFKSGFPKKFANTQGINFDNVKGPLWEYPLIMDAGYVVDNAVNNPPGPDRVIFNYDPTSNAPTGPCQLAGELTSNGAGPRGFIPCTEQY